MPLAVPLLIEGLTVSPWAIARPLLVMSSCPSPWGWWSSACRSAWPPGQPWVKVTALVATVATAVLCVVVYGKGLLGMAGSLAVASQIIFFGP